MPRKLLTAGGALLDGTVEGILQGLVTDNHEEQHLARIAILIVPGIGCNLFSVSSATKKGVVSIFDFDNPRLELSGITVLLRAEDDDVYSLVFDLSADSHGGKELAMSAMTNAQLWHRRLGRLNKRSLELMQGRDDNGVAFDGSIDHCNVCGVGKSRQLAHPKKAKHTDITMSFQLVHGDLMGPFKPAARGGYEYMSKITDQFTKQMAVYLLCTKDQAPASLQLFVTSTAIPFGSRIVSWRADKGGEYTGEDFKAYCQEMASLTSLRLLTHHNKLVFQNALDGHCGRWSGACVLTAGYRHLFFVGLVTAASYICNRIPDSAVNMETPFKKLYGKDADLFHLKIVGARACVVVVVVVVFLT